MVAESGSSARAMETMPRIVFDVGAELALERVHPAVGGVSGIAGARIAHAALHHETFHQAVKGGAVVPARGHQLQEIAHVIRAPSPAPS